VLPARHRLRAAADFSAVVRGAGTARAGSQLIVVHARNTPDRIDTRDGTGSGTGDGKAGLMHTPRVGFVVSKAVGGAVTRNRTKRVLRHLVAARLPGIPNGVDLVVRANPAAATASTGELAAELDALLPRVLRRLQPALEVSR
jgi:ribonuclease P protein component